MNLRGWASPAVAAVIATHVAAQEAPNIRSRKIEAVKVTSAPKIDGVLDDPCWQKAPKAAPFYDNYTSALVKDQTTVWIGYDDKWFYVAFECLESQPAKIVAREKKRGGDIYMDDFVAVFFNPYGTRNGSDESNFLVNPLGTQNAYIAEGRANKLEWEGEWLSAAKIGPDRWTVEMAVPWKILKHRKTGGRPVDMDVNFGRSQVWSGVFSCWSYTTPQRKPEFTGIWRGVAIPDGVDEPPLSTLWYGLSGFERERAVDRMGLDMRYKLDAEQTALFTVNPDFGNVEQSVTSIDFSYAGKIGEETRPFFLEGAGFLSGFGDSFFTSVLIPNIDVGGKYYGKPARDLSVGALATHSFDAERTDGLFSLSKRFGERDRVQFGWASRNEPGYANNVFSAGGSARRGNFLFTGQYVRSDSEPGGGETGYLGGSWGAGPLRAYFEHGFTSPAYRPGDGFVFYNDDRAFYTGISYYTPWRSGPLKEFSIQLDNTESWHYDGGFFRESFSCSAAATTRSDWFLHGSARVGRFEDNRDFVVQWGGTYPVSNSDRYAGLSASFGRQNSLDYRSLLGNWVWRLNRKLKVGGGSELVEIGGFSSQHTVTLSFDVAHDQAVGGRMVMRDGVANWYLSYRKSGYKGTEYYVILGDPNAEKFQTRLVFKVVGVL